jgi:phosphoribosylamine--glycine ligase
LKVLVVGGGGREHAIIKALGKSPRKPKLYAAPGNGGIGREAERVAIKASDIAGIVDFAESNAIDYVVVAPDDPLALGLVDALAAKGIPAFGPDKLAARIEASKIFSKNLMKKYGIPTAAFEAFTDYAEAEAYIKTAKYPLVVKADGLALGKGVIIAQDENEALEAISGMMRGMVFGESGSRVVLEEFLTGPEVSVLAFCDGRTLVPMVSSMDHKRAFDANSGPNTGGMGTIAPNPHYTPEMAALCEKTIFKPTVQAMRAEGCPFKGCLYFGLMLTQEGPKTIEYNCRFGDPETQVVLPLLESDLLEIMLAVTEERLESSAVRFKDGHAACVVLASGGYPGKYETGLEITGLDENGGLIGDDVTVFHAGTAYNDSMFSTGGGRVLGVTATGVSLQEALDAAYSAVDGISFKGMHYRTDIGKY